MDWRFIHLPPFVMTYTSYVFRHTELTDAENAKASKAVGKPNASFVQRETLWTAESEFIGRNFSRHFELTDSNQRICTHPILLRRDVEIMLRGLEQFTKTHLTQESDIASANEDRDALNDLSNSLKGKDWEFNQNYFFSVSGIEEGANS